MIVEVSAFPDVCVGRTTSLLSPRAAMDLLIAITFLLCLFTASHSHKTMCSLYLGLFFKTQEWDVLVLRTRAHFR